MTAGVLAVDVEVYDPTTDQTVQYHFVPAAPARGLADGQTLGCRCPHCSDHDDERPCLHAGRDMKCYCPGCADPGHPGNTCWKKGAMVCARCGRRDWASLKMPYKLCNHCWWEIYHDRQADLGRWSE